MISFVLDHLIALSRPHLQHLDWQFMFVQMGAMSAYQGAFSSNPALLPAVKRPVPIFSS